MTILFAGVLLIEFLFVTFYPSWTFTKGSFIIANNIISYLSFFGLIFFAVFTFRPKSLTTIALGVVELFLFSVVTFIEINPIDTTTEPIDIKTIVAQTDGKKIIVRQYKNAKTNTEIIDTVTVKDNYIFRRIFK
jgi:hypothetical protein